jgi:hypothetical protein
LSDVAQGVFNATTANVVADPAWGAADLCGIDMIIYERLSDTVKLLNKTETIKNQLHSNPTVQFDSANGKCMKDGT